MSRSRARTSSIVSGVALALLAAPLTGIPVASAEAPGPVGLSDQSPNSTTSVLSWDRDLSAARYTVQVDNDASFASPEFNQTTTSTSVVPHTALKPGTNHWRVRSTSPSGVSSEWSTASFQRADPLVPSPLGPVNGAELVQPDEPPLLQWSEVPGAKSYSVEIDDAPDFIGATKLTTNTLSIVPSSPLSMGTWFWRVTATDASGQLSAPSEPSSFTIRALPAPELVSPDDSPDEKVEDVVLDWAPVKGAKTYQLQVSVNDGFEAGDLKANLTNLTSTRWSPPNGMDNDQYYWRVRAVDAAGSPSAWSASPYAFDRQWPDRPWPVHPVQPGFPEYPADFDTADPGHLSHPFHPTYVRNHDPEALPIATSDEPTPFLQWTPVQHASSYQLQISTTANFTPLTTNTCVVVGTTFTPTNTVFPTGKQVRLDHTCEVTQGTRLYWRVRPMDAPFTVEGIYSPTQKFVWEPEWFASITPADGATVEVPRFSWTSLVPASQFRVEIKNATGRRVHQATTSASSYTPVGVDLDPTESPFTWSLTAYAADGSSSLIQSRTFTLAPPTSGPTGTPLAALSGTEQDAPSVRAPELSWVPFPGADHYKVSFGYADVSAWLVPAGEEAFEAKLHYPRMTDTGTRIMAPGRYKWQVSAFDDTGRLIGTSDVNTVRIADFEPVTGQRIALEGLSLAEGAGCDLPMDTVSNTATCPEVPTTPVLRWDPQDGIAFYGVYVSFDQHFTNLTERRIPASTGHMYAYTTVTLPDNTSGVPYYWHIRPCKAPGICGPDPVSSATGLAKHAFKKVSPQVETEPTADVVSTNEVTFTWRDYHESNQDHRVTRDGAPSWSAAYHRAPAEGGAINPRDLSNQSAARYRIRVATDTAFSDVIDNQLVDQTTYTAPTKLYPEGPLYWKVSALDTNGYELSSSVTRSFSKSSAPAAGLSPAPQAQVQGTVPFRWEPEAFAGQYELEVSRNDERFSSVNRVFSTKVWSTAYTWTKPIPVSSDPYYWRVRRLDSSGNPTTWSTPVPFRVVSQAVTLTSPATDSTQVPNGPQLTWEPLAGAATYLVEVKDSAGKTVDSRTTPATAYVPFVSLASGRHTWSVTARDNDGKPLAPASSDTFTVDTSLEAESAPEVSYDTERPGVESVLSVEPLAWNRVGVTESYQWLRGGRDIRGATGRTYEATLADFGKEISVRVTGSLPAFQNAVLTSAPVLIGPGGLVIASAPPRITGTFAVGQKLTTTDGEWPRGAKVSRQWLRNGYPIPGATAKTYTLTLNDAVSYISVRVIGSISGRSDGSSTSTSRLVPKAHSTSTASLSSTKVKRGTKVTFTARVSVPGVAAPTGTVVVFKGKKRMKLVKLTTNDRGQVSFVLPKKLRKKGKHRLVLQYNGTTKIATSRSKVVVLKVT